MKDEIVKILGNLIRHKSTNDNLEAIASCYKYIDEELSFFPFIKKFFNKNGVESRIWSTIDTLTPEYILNAHIDVVPAPDLMFKLKRNGDKLMGRGVSDMKFSIASYILVLKEIYESTKKLPSVAIMLTSDEERGGGNGVGYLVNEIGYCPKVAFVPDGGDNNKIVENAKGVLQLEIISTGCSAHASKLWEGEGAIEKIAIDINNLRQKYPYPDEPIWANTMNIGKISGGVQTNQVADSASIFVDLRCLPETNINETVEEIKTICPDCKVKILTTGDVFHVDRNNFYIKRWAKLISADDSVFINEHGASDGRYFTATGIPTIVSKPIGGFIHHPDEWISLKSVTEFSNNLKMFLLNKK